MTIGAVTINTDNSMPGDTPALNQPATGGASSFSDALRASSSQVGGADLDAIFEAAGQKYNISPNLLKSVAKVESNFRPYVTSKAGAMGIMQLMPDTARGLGVADAFDPAQNIMGGAKYLRQMLDKFGGDLRLALGAYNAGPGNVAKHGGVPSFSQNYVSKVLCYARDDINAGTVQYSGFNAPNQDSSAFGASDFRKALSQMALTKIVEMQMHSSRNDKPKVVTGHGVFGSMDF